MKIAINARFTGQPYFEGYGRFTDGLTKTWMELYPEDGLTLLLDSEPDDHISLPYLVKKLPVNHPLFWKLWYDHRLPAMAQKTEADILFSTHGIGSMNVKIPQVLALNHLAFLDYPDGLTPFTRNFLKWNTSQYIRKADHIITVSESSKTAILNRYPQAKGKLSVIYKAADPGFIPLNWEEKEKIKDQHTQGFDYFLYAGSIHTRKNIINLLKGFSWFKNRHKSGLKLVLTGDIWDKESFSNLLQSYKYKDDVLLLGYVPQNILQKLMASAYAFVYPALGDGFALPILEAMQTGTPVICSNTAANTEITQDACVYCSPNDAEAFGKAMGLLYKDEAHRAGIIQAGLERSSSFSWENSTKQLREVFARLA